MNIHDLTGSNTKLVHQFLERLDGAETKQISAEHTGMDQSTRLEFGYPHCVLWFP